MIRKVPYSGGRNFISIDVTKVEKLTLKVTD